MTPEQERYKLRILAQQLAQHYRQRGQVSRARFWITEARHYGRVDTPLRA